MRNLRYLQITRDIQKVNFESIFYYIEYNGITCNFFPIFYKVLNVASYIKILMYFYCYLLNSVSGKPVALLSCPSLPLSRAPLGRLQVFWSVGWDVDGLDVDCLDEYLVFLPLYEVIEVLIRAVFVLFNWLILLLRLLPNSHLDSGGTFFVNCYILAGNQSFICSLLNWLISAVTTLKRAKASMTGVIISLHWSDLRFIFIILSHACHSTSCLECYNATKNTEQF